MGVCVIFKYILMTIFGLALTVLFIPILLPLAILFGIICTVMVAAIKIRFGIATNKARGTDVVHGKQSSNSLPILNIGIRVNGELNMKLMQERMTALINNTYNTNGEKRYKRLTELYSKAFGYNIWKPYDDFDIANHVKEISMHDIYEQQNYTKECEHCLKNNQTKGSATKGSATKGSATKFDTKSKMDAEDWTVFMKVFLDQYGMTLFDEGRPQWETLVVRNDSQSYTILYRFHHAISDGVYLSRMFCEDVLDVPYMLFAKYKPPHPFQRIIVSIWSFALFPFGLWNIVSHCDYNPLHGKRLRGDKKFFLTNQIPLETFRTIQSNAPMKVSLHAIVFSCVSYALAKHFYKRNHIIPLLTALTPVPLQNLSHPIKMKNKFAVGAINFPVSLTMTDPTNGTGANFKEENSALRRLNVVQNSLKDMAKNISLLPLNSVINGFCSVLPTAIAERVLSVSGCSLAISHMPGAKIQTKIYDGVVIDHMFWIPDREPMGVGVSIYSYNGNLRAGLLIDNALLKYEEEGQALMDNFAAQVCNLAHECQISTKKDKGKISSTLKVIP